MADGIEHLDFYPKSPETISDLVKMHALDVTQQEIQEGAKIAHPETIGRIPEATLGIMATFVVAAAFAAGIARTWIAKKWERTKSQSLKTADANNMANRVSNDHS